MYCLYCECTAFKPLGRPPPPLEPLPPPPPLAMACRTYNNYINSYTPLTPSGRRRTLADIEAQPGRPSSEAGGTAGGDGLSSSSGAAQAGSGSAGAAVRWIAASHGRASGMPVPQVLSRVSLGRAAEWAREPGAARGQQQQVHTVSGGQGTRFLGGGGSWFRRGYGHTVLEGL